MGNQELLAKIKELYSIRSEETLKKGVEAIADDVRDSGDPKILLRYAPLLMIAGYLAGAIKAFNAGLAKSEKAREYVYAADYVHVEIEDRRRKDWSTLIEVGSDYVKLDELSEQWYRKAIELEPYNGEAWLGLAKVLEMGKRAESELALQKALAYAPDDFHVLLYAADRLKNEEAVPYAQRAVELISFEKPYDEDLKSLLKTCINLRLEDEENKVFEYWQQKDGSIKPLLCRAHAYYSRNPEKAISFFKKILELDPENTEAGANIDGLIKDMQRKDESCFLS